MTDCTIFGGSKLPMAFDDTKNLYYQLFLCYYIIANLISQYLFTHKKITLIGGFFVI